MTTEEIIALAKEKLGQEITEQEAQDYINGITPLPDEALELVSGGALCAEKPIATCPVCSGNAYGQHGVHLGYVCYSCNMRFSKQPGSYPVVWELYKKCHKCQRFSYYVVSETEQPSLRRYRCLNCDYAMG